MDYLKKSYPLNPQHLKSILPMGFALGKVQKYERLDTHSKLTFLCVMKSTIEDPHSENVWNRQSIVLKKKTSSIASKELWISIVDFFVLVEEEYLSDDNQNVINLPSVMQSNACLGRS